ncbi:hypothetical protein CAAN1_19S00342 [[Candida] anglica]|uniref:ERCC1-like central domain-containing protein n=1 Tax=[Candida] anglica TaxID=148631 RepID=A0ABP0E535_9ASCO
MAEETDQSSFASILAGVQRMREQYGDSEQKSDDVVVESRKSLPSIDKQPVPITFTPPHVSERAPPVSEKAPPVSERTPLVSERPIRTYSPVARGGPAVQTSSVIKVSSKQKGNPLLQAPSMKTKRWTYDDTIVSDYYINPTLQYLFLSLKYHKLRPEYIDQRLKGINRGTSGASTSSGTDRSLRILLVVVDIDSHQEVLRELTVKCVRSDMSLVLAWSYEEAANYICFGKDHELIASRVDTTAIRGVQSDDYRSCIVSSLTSIRAVNKTDVVNLLANCKSFEKIVKESCKGKELGNIQGLGARKVENMKSVFSEPFIYNKEW